MQVFGFSEEYGNSLVMSRKAVRVRSSALFFVGICKGKAEMKEGPDVPGPTYCNPPTRHLWQTSVQVKTVIHAGERSSKGLLEPPLSPNY
jgi:hypothetical protein